MIEQIVLDYLKKELAVPAYMEMPERPPKSFVLLERTGGGGQYVYTAMFAVQSYAGSLLQAAKLHEAVKTAMLNLADLDEVCKVKYNSGYNFTDTTTKHYRYQGVYDITHY